MKIENKLQTRQTLMSTDPMDKHLQELPQKNVYLHGPGIFSK